MFGFLKKVFNKDTSTRRTDAFVGMSPSSLMSLVGRSCGDLSEITYFVCLKMLSEAMAKIPLKLYRETEKGVVKFENETFRILKTRPNSFMTPSVFWTTIENNRNHYGNAYVLVRKKIARKKYGFYDKVEDFWVLPSENVKPVYDKKGVFGGKGKLWYLYRDSLTGERYVYRQEDILHFKTSCTFDGFLGKPVRDILNDTISGAFESQKYTNNLYKNGLTAGVGVQMPSDLGEKETAEVLRFLGRYSTGASNAGGFMPIPNDVQLVPLNIKLTDAQFFELKKYNSLQIASAFGIKPSQLNNYEKSSYSSAEMQQLDFYVDTMLYIQKQYEEELNYKLLTKEEIAAGVYCKFNEKAILRSDASQQMETLVKGISSGIYTPNEARELLDLPKVDGGDVSIVNGTFIPLDRAGEQYKTTVKGGEKDE